jgi:hypothetical protein
MLKVLFHSSLGVRVLDLNLSITAITTVPRADSLTWFACKWLVVSN